MIQSAKIKKTALILYLTAVHILAAFFIYDRIGNPHSTIVVKNDAQTVEPVIPIPSPVEIPYDPNNLPPEIKTETKLEIKPTGSLPVQQITPIPENAGKLMIPVAGIKRDNLQDTYTQSRSGGRVHNAIDIMATVGTPVVAAADGEIAKFFDSDLGGITIYQWSGDRKFVYYYAHLQKRADNLQEKQFVKQGTVLGYVGDTGNSGAGNYHLHFSIIVPTNPKSHWDGMNLNPYPILKDGIESPAK